MDYKAAIREAAEAADEAPDDLREIAFRSVLERLLGTPLSPASHEQDLSNSQARPANRPEWKQRIVSGLPEAHVVQEKGDRAQQAVWAVVTLYGRGLEVTTEEIRNLIRTELGVAPQNVENTGRTLRKLTPRYVTRKDRPDGQGYYYEPTARSLEALEDLLE